MTPDIIIHKSALVMAFMSAVIIWEIWKPVTLFDRIARLGVVGAMSAVAVYFAITAPPA